MQLFSNVFRFLVRLCFITFEVIVSILVVFFIYIVLVSRISDPELDKIDVPNRIKVAENHYRIENSWLKKNKYGIWEMYIEGDAYKRGLVYGKLAKELIQTQEVHFVNQINDFVPSEAWQNVLRLMIGFFNKDISKNIPNENLQEIYGISQSFSDKYDYIATKFCRILNYHAAHDIGHALNDYSLVGCTSFALKGTQTYDNKLLVARNFDFYVGDEFAEEKLLLFVNPSKGFKFSSYSWAGFTGVASGMNEKGLSVTINASKSELPTKAKTPISIVAREILQYASTCKEAIAIAKKRETFVSETIMISSKIDNLSILIEKSPSKTAVFYPKSDQLICANHFQSKQFKTDKINRTNIKESDSHFRFDRVNELLNQKKKFNVNDVVEILRDQKGVKNDSLGMGNPRAINQLIAHHSIVFQNHDLKLWISTKSYQMGEFLLYDLNLIFKNKKINSKYTKINKDVFLESKAYHNFEYYRKIKKKIIKYLNFNKQLSLDDKEISTFIKSNSFSYLTFEYLGDYFSKKKQFYKAKHYYKIALTKELASLQVKKEINEKIEILQ
jgi:isopenicillin-N N-acyltransferase-like protein